MVIIDASIANKLFLPLEEGHEEVKIIFKKHCEDEEKIFVPDLLFYEVTNTLVTKTSIPLPFVIKSLNQLHKLQLTVCHFSDKQMGKIAKMAKQYHISVYDASYAVLAKEKKCYLITADTKFIKQVNLPFIKTLSS